MANAKTTDIPIAYLRECLILDATAPSGLRWRKRPLAHFIDERAQRVFNTQFAGKHAGARSNINYYWRVSLTISGQKRDVLAHRIIVALTKGRWPTHDVDHENRSKSANEISNLREATHGQNMQNQNLSSRNTSGFKGVSWDKRWGKWRADIRANGVQFTIGYFDIFEHACQARIGAESVLHPFRVKPKPLDPAMIIPDGALVTGVYSFTGKPKRVTYTFTEAA